MQKFQFKLETALTMRTRLEEQARIAAAEEERRCREAERQLDEVLRDMRRHEQHRAELQRADLDIQLLADSDRYAAALSRVCSQQQQRVRQMQQSLQTARQNLQQRRQDCEALEKLRGRRLAEHTQEQARQEQNALDESTILRWRA